MPRGFRNWDITDSDHDIRRHANVLTREDPESMFDLSLSATRLVDQRGLAQFSVVDGLVPEVLFECASTWWSGYERPHFVAMNYCLDGCKSEGGVDFRGSASCATDLSHGFRAWGESHPAPVPQAELR